MHCVLHTLASLWGRATGVDSVCEIPVILFLTDIPRTPSCEMSFSLDMPALY